MRLVLTTLLLPWLLCSHAQSPVAVTGMLLDSTDHQPLPFAHVSNYTSGWRTVTNGTGHFKIPAEAGDTIVFSMVGYQTLGWVVQENWFREMVTLHLPQDTMLLDEVVVSRIPPEEQFKRRVLDLELKDTSFWYHGIAPPVYHDDPMLLEKTINNPLFAVTHPTDFLYHKFSKTEKERRKYYQITQKEPTQRNVYEKVSREWIGEVTGLDGDELTTFISYCDLSIDYLDKTPLYLIREELLVRLISFKKEQKG